MVVLGIDPGFVKFGYGILRENKDKSIDIVDYGCIKNKPNKYSALLVIHNKVNTLIKKHKPDVLVIEQIFFSKNTKTALSVSEVRGVVMLAGIKNNIKIAEITPLEVKLSLTGYGYATKKQLMYIVKSLLKFKGDLPPDTSDAVSLALCYINSYKIRSLT